MSAFLQKITYRKISLALVICTCVFFSFSGSVFAAQQENFRSLGTANAYSAGAIQKVPEGFALTAIGYGSDDWQCVIGIKTAPVKADGSVDFSQTDSAWSKTTCTRGAPTAGHAAFEKVFEPVLGYVVTGWSWGANTGGGQPLTDSFPVD